MHTVLRLQTIFFAILKRKRSNNNTGSNIALLPVLIYISVDFRIFDKFCKFGFEGIVRSAFCFCKTVDKVFDSHFVLLCFLFFFLVSRYFNSEKACFLQWIGRQIQRIGISHLCLLKNGYAILTRSIGGNMREKKYFMPEPFCCRIRFS